MADQPAPRARDAWTLFHVGGVPLRIHYTWLFIAAYLTVLFTRDFRELARAAEVGDASLLLPPLAWGILMTLALFACVALHELGHVVVARRQGARVHAITLMMLGGVSEVSEVERPRHELLMACAGPLTSFALAAVFYGLFRLSSAATPDLHFGLFYLAQVNLVLGLFNLLPAFPLDGGRVLRSALVPRFGRARATAIAAGVGKVLAVLLAIAGIFGGGWWLVLIALFVFLAGDSEARAVHAQTALRGLRVGDLATRRLATMAPGASAADAAAALMSAHTGAALVLDGATPVGVVTAAALAALPVRARQAARVADVMQPARVVDAGDDVGRVLALFAAERLDAVVVREGGALVGVLDRDDVARGVALGDLATGHA